jgi:hypothetical protein
MPTSRSSGRRPSVSGGSHRPCATSVRPQWPPTRNRTPPNGCSLTAASGSATAATTWPAPSSVRRNTASQASNGPSSRQSPATADHTGTATGRRSSRRATASCTREAVHYRGGPRSLRASPCRPAPASVRSRRHPGSAPTAQWVTATAPSPRSLRCSPSLRPTARARRVVQHRVPAGKHPMAVVVALAVHRLQAEPGGHPRAEEHLDRVGDVDLRRRRVGCRGCAAAARSEQERCDGRRDGSPRSAAQRPSLAQARHHGQVRDGQCDVPSRFSTPQSRHVGCQ